MFLLEQLFTSALVLFFIFELFIFTLPSRTNYITWH